MLSFNERLAQAKALQSEYQKRKEEDKIRTEKEINNILSSNYGWMESKIPPKIDDIILTLELSNSELKYEVFKYDGDKSRLLEKWLKLPPL